MTPNGRLCTAHCRRHNDLVAVPLLIDDGAQNSFLIALAAGHRWSPPSARWMRLYYIVEQEAQYLDDPKLKREAIPGERPKSSVTNI